MSGKMASATPEPGFRMVTAALVFLQGIQLLGLSGQWNPAAVSVVAGVALAASLWSLHRHPIELWISVGLLILGLAGGGLLVDHDLGGVGGSPFHAPFFFYLATIVLVRVLQAKGPTEDALLGSACAYILLSLAFASAYEAVEFASPGAIAGLETSAEAGTVFSQLSYFSLVTLTTLGYGDLAPIHPLCRSLAIVESVIGVLFPALVVARIVGAYSLPEARRLDRREPDPKREVLGARGLFVLLPTIVLALPWVQKTAWGGLVVAALLLSMTVAGIYFVTGRRRTIILGAGLAVTAFVLRVLGGDLVLIAIVFEVALITSVAWRMTLWFFRRDEATTSVILAAACIYWLIGIGFADAFTMFGQLFPAAMGESASDPLGPMLYFSFMTLTTTGYGDFAPVIPAARALASLEAFVGVFYPAVVIAKLVPLYGAQD